MKINTAFVIDDDPIFTFIFVKLLEKTNKIKNITTYSNALLALDALKNIEFQPQTIFLDLNMPIFNGWQFLDKIKSLNLEEKFDVYVVSSTIDYEEEKKLATYKFIKKFINKPLNVEILSEILKGEK